MRHRIAAITFILPIPLIFSLLSGIASAEDACHNILTNGFYKDYARSSAKLRDRAMYAELCTLDLQQARNVIKRARQSGDKALGLSYGLFHLEDEVPKAGTSLADLGENKFREWKTGYCSQNSVADSSKAAEFFMQEAAAGNAGSTSAVEAWSACMRKREGLSCWVSPAPASEEVLLNVNWTKTGSSQSPAQPKVEHTFLTRGAVSKFKGVEAKRILPADYKLTPGTLQIPITRPADVGVFAHLKIDHEGAEHSCKVFVPGDRDFALSVPFVNRQKFRYPG